MLRSFTRISCIIAVVSAIGHGSPFSGNGKQNTLLAWNGPGSGTAALEDLRLPIPGQLAGGLGDENSNNRLTHVLIHTVASAAIYGLTIPMAFGVDEPRYIIGLPLIALPVAFGTHFFSMRDRPVTDAHLLGTSYLASAAVLASYALPFVALGDDSPRLATAAVLSGIAYPFGIWGGYELGSAYENDPGRIRTQIAFASIFGALGALSPMLYFQRPFGEERRDLTTRLMLGQALLLATGGHFLADRYRIGETVPAGVQLGILHFAVLGGLLGVQAAALADADNYRAWIGLPLTGGTLGFMGGLFFFEDRWDTLERGVYNSLGMGAGALMGLGGILLSQTSSQAGITSFLVGGTVLGYVASYLLTMGMEERPGSASAPDSSNPGRISFVPVPLPEMFANEDGVQLGWRIPGLTVRLP